MMRRPPRSTRFPYTTLCRSIPERARDVRGGLGRQLARVEGHGLAAPLEDARRREADDARAQHGDCLVFEVADRKSTRLNSSHANISYAVFCLKKTNTARSPC